MVKTRFCHTCSIAKDATPENFQRRGSTFRSPCKTCMKNPKKRKPKDTGLPTPERRLEIMRERTDREDSKTVDISPDMAIKTNTGMFDDMKFSGYGGQKLDTTIKIVKEKNNKVKVEPDTKEVLVDIGYALNAIYERHNRFFTFQVNKSNVILVFHGSPTLTLKGTASEVIAAALKD